MHICAPLVALLAVGAAVQAQPQVTSLDPGCGCTSEYSPVCDIDGNLYNNSGCAVCEGVSPGAPLWPCSEVVQPANATTGDCSECDVSWNPVCDSGNMLLAANPCLAGCAGYREDTIMTCTPQAPQQPLAIDAAQLCVCTTGFHPVCDYQGLFVAPNQCSAGCMGYTDGEVKTCLVPLVPSPTEECGCDGLEYTPMCDKYGHEVAPNLCAAHCAGFRELVYPCTRFEGYSADQVGPFNAPLFNLSCPLVYNPICTETGKWIGSNTCEAHAKGYAVTQTFECSDVEGFNELDSESSSGYYEMPGALCGDEAECTDVEFRQCLLDGTVAGINSCAAGCGENDKEDKEDKTVPCAALPMGSDIFSFVPYERNTCRCPHEDLPVCLSTGTPVSRGFCNAICRGYNQVLLTSCRTELGVSLADMMVSPLCQDCDLTVDPVCDSRGTQVAVNSCLATCKGYNSTEFSTSFCTDPPSPPPEDCNCLAAAADEAPVCDTAGAQLASTACQAEQCKGYSPEDFSQANCGMRHLYASLVAQLAATLCQCPMGYHPVCDQEGTVVGPNACAAECLGHQSSSFSPCSFVLLEGHPDIEKLAAIADIQGPEFIHMADSAEVANIQVVCLQAASALLPKLCANYNTSVGYPELVLDLPVPSGTSEPFITEKKTVIADSRAVVGALRGYLILLIPLLAVTWQYAVFCF